MSQGKYITELDSSSTMVRAVASYLKGREFSSLDMQPRKISRLMLPFIKILSRLPARASEFVYSMAPLVL